MKRKRIALLLPLALSLGLLGFLGRRAASPEAIQTPVVVSASERIAAAPGSAAEIQDYGRRQSQQPGLSDFAGGHHDEAAVIIVGSSCGAVLIAILVLVILL